MRAAVLTSPKQFEVRDLPLPEPGPTQVRIRLEGCGVCASNVPVWEGRPWFSYPMEPGSPGHEGWGVIDAVGRDVRELQPGDRVAALGCHACHCTQVEWIGDRIGSRFRSHNLRGRHKVELLHELRRGWPGNVIAYGNSASDLDHLRLADQGVVVTTRRGMGRRATALGLSVVSW